MIKNNFEAYRSYKNTRIGLEKEILVYLKERLQDNEASIRELIELREDKISYEEIIQKVTDKNENETEYKKSSYWIITPSNFMHAVVNMPVGVIGVQTTNTMIALEYWLKAIQTHNAIIIIDKEYDEFDVKQYILQLIQSVLRKFDIKTEIIDRLPYEESVDEEYQKIIKFEENEEKIEKREIIENNGKSKLEEKLVFIEDLYFEERAEKDNQGIENVTIIKGNFEDVIQNINKKEYEVVSVYTQNAELAYRAINEISCSNIFINTSIKNIEKIKKDNEKSVDDLYFTKNIIFPFQNTEKQVTEFNKVEKISETNENDINVVNEFKNINETKELVKYEESDSLLKKIKDIFRKIFNRKGN